MDHFKLPEELKTGIKEIDKDHEILVRYANELLAFASREESINTEDAYKSVIEIWKFAVNHFNSEEKVMRHYNYPYFDQHRTNHQNISNKLLNLKSRFKNEKIVREDIIQFSNLIAEWFTKETLPYDKKLANYLKEEVGFGNKLKKVLSKYFNKK